MAQRSTHPYSIPERLDQLPAEAAQSSVIFRAVLDLRVADLPEVGVVEAGRVERLRRRQKTTSSLSASSSPITDRGAEQDVSRTQAQKTVRKFTGSPSVLVDCAPIERNAPQGRAAELIERGVAKARADVAD
jgi:hypothetical protein